MLIFWAACAALGAFWTVEFIKAVLPWPMQVWTKQVASLGAAGALLWGVAPESDVGWMLALLGATGASALLHRLHRLLGAAGDDHRTAVMARGIGRGR